jgi:hypothetical protein
MKKNILFILIPLFFACSQTPETSIEHLNGYWEIEEVTLANGTKHSYTYNATIDYIQINDDLTGFRKKLKPNFKGTYETTNDVEHIKVVIENDSLNLYYTTAFSNWKETVLNATKDELRIQNATKVVYLYKRHQPLNLE